MSRIFIAMILAVVLAGCALGPRIDPEARLNLHRAHAGEPVPSILAPRALRWAPLGDSTLVLHTGPRRAYLLELAGFCVDLRHATTIRITRSVTQISAGFDDVIVLDPVSPIGRVPCRIRTIQPLDLERLEPALQALRDGAGEPRAVEFEQREG